MWLAHDASLADGGEEGFVVVGGSLALGRLAIGPQPIEIGAAQWVAAGGDHRPAVEDRSAALQHHPALVRIGVDQAADDLLPGAHRSLGQSGVEVEQGQFLAERGHDQHEACQHTRLNIVGAEPFMYCLLVVAAPGREWLPGSGDGAAHPLAPVAGRERDQGNPTALHQIKEGVRVRVLPALPIAEHDADRGIELARVDRVRRALKEKLGAGALGGGEPGQPECHAAPECSDGGGGRQPKSQRARATPLKGSSQGVGRAG